MESPSDIHGLVRGLQDLHQANEYEEFLLLFRNSLPRLDRASISRLDSVEVYELGVELSLVFPLLAADNDIKTLEAIRSLSRHGRLPAFRNAVDIAILDAAVTAHILHFVSAHPGVLQKDLPKLLVFPRKERIRQACYWASKLRVLDRTPRSGSYALSIPTDEQSRVADAPEPSLAELFGNTPEPAPWFSSDAPPDLSEEALGRLLEPKEHGDFARNIKAAQYEKAGQTDIAISLYEANVRDGQRSSQSVDHLVTLYRKAGRLEDEIRVISWALGRAEAGDQSFDVGSAKFLALSKRLDRAETLLAKRDDA